MNGLAMLTVILRICSCSWHQQLVSPERSRLLRKSLISNNHGATPLANGFQLLWSVSLNARNLRPPHRQILSVCRPTVRRPMVCWSLSHVTPFGCGGVPGSVIVKRHCGQWHDRPPF